MVSKLKRLAVAVRRGISLHSSQLATFADVPTMLQGTLVCLKCTHATTSRGATPGLPTSAVCFRWRQHPHR